MTEGELENYEALEYDLEDECNRVISVLEKFGICKVYECEAFDFEIEGNNIIAQRGPFDSDPDIIFPKKYLQLTEEELERECENYKKEHPDPPMPQEYKEALRKDLELKSCYGLKVNYKGLVWDYEGELHNYTVILERDGCIVYTTVDQIRPYLREFWDMSREECEEYRLLKSTIEREHWENSHLIDNHYLYSRGLCLDYRDYDPYL